MRFVAPGSQALCSSHQSIRLVSSRTRQHNCSPLKQRVSKQCESALCCRQLKEGLQAGPLESRELQRVPALLWGSVPSGASTPQCQGTHPHCSRACNKGLLLRQSWDHSSSALPAHGPTSSKAGQHKAWPVPEQSKLLAGWQGAPLAGTTGSTATRLQHVWRDGARAANIGARPNLVDVCPAPHGATPRSMLI